LDDEIERGQFIIEYKFIWDSPEAQEGYDTDTQHLINIVHHTKESAKYAVEKILNNIIKVAIENGELKTITGYEIIRVHTIDEFLTNCARNKSEEEDWEEDWKKARKIVGKLVQVDRTDSTVALEYWTEEDGDTFSWFTIKKFTEEQKNDLLSLLGCDVDCIVVDEEITNIIRA